MYSRPLSAQPSKDAPDSPSNSASKDHAKSSKMHRPTAKRASSHNRNISGNFSEVEFMDSGLARSLTADLPVLGLKDELDSLQPDDPFVEEYLLSRLQEAQRRLQEVRHYKDALVEEPPFLLTKPASPLGTPISAPSVTPNPPTLAKKRTRRSERLFVASFRLPLTVEVNDDGNVKSSVSSGSLGLTSAFKDLLGRMPIIWMGTPVHTYRDSKQATPMPRQKVELHFKARYRKAAGLLSYLPIFPDEVDAAAHQEFCNSVLWPLFHYIPLNYAGEKMYQIAMFEGYKRVNYFYAEALIDEWKRSGIDESCAMFWIHDFHLFLVPKILRDRMPNARIGFFLHTPFPTGEVFRTLAPRKDLLEGLLASDLIGFHTYDYARHFLSACERLLGLTTKPNAVDFQGLFVQVGIYPFGTDPTTFLTAMKQSKVQVARDLLRESFAGKKIVVGVDRLDYIKGIPHKLLAIEHLLENHPEWIRNVVFLQVTTPSMAATEEYHSFRAEILEMVGRINGRFSTIEDIPILYREHAMTFEELCALYSVADVALITSLRDGMNLVSYEYIMCQKDRNGVLILSEFTGAAQSLPGALLVNPWNLEEVSDAICQSLEMPDFERELKYQTLYRHVMVHTAAAWGVSFIDDLVKYSATRREKSKHLVKMRSQHICESYKAAKGKRVFFLDCDGTLQKYQIQPELAEPSEALLTALKKLTSSDQNIVFIVTGRQKSTVLEWFGETGTGFAVEHGFAIRWPNHLRGHFGNGGAEVDSGTGKKGMETKDMGRECKESSVKDKDKEWEELISGRGLAGMSEALEIAGQLLHRIEDCTPSSFLTKKESAYSWHFSDANPDFAMSKAQDARQALEEVLAGSALEVLMAEKVLLVRPRGVNKGAAVEAVMRRLNERGVWTSWVLCIGNDCTDEDMFKELGNSSCLEKDAEVITCTVGRKRSRAKYYVKDVDEVVELLREISAPE